MQNFGQFWTTSDFDREYLRNGSRNALQTIAIPPSFNEKSPVNYSTKSLELHVSLDPLKCTF